MSQDAAAFEVLTAQLHQDLQPDTTLENIIFKELARASWRLELCARAEDSAADGAARADIDRARTTALNIIMKTTAELRRLQTNRRIGIEIYPEDTDISHHGIASHKEIITALTSNERRLTVKSRLEHGDHLDEMFHQADARISREYRERNPPAAAAAPAAKPGPVAAPAEPSDSSFCKTIETPPIVAIPRRAPCPCKSGDRYKNCCGKNAPPVLHHGARPKAA